MKLRPYQQKAIADVFEAWKITNKVCLQMPTGSGKTATGLEIIKGFDTSIFIVHREELLKQTARAYDRAGIKYQFIASGYPAKPNGATHYIAMVQTFVKRMDSYSFQPDLIVVDEAHISVSKTYQKIFQRYLQEPSEYNFWQGQRASKLLGLTATPERLDGKGLNIVFDKLIIGPSVRGLIDEHYLADYDPYAAPQAISTKGLKISMGDFEKARLEERASHGVITGNAVKEYQKHLTGKQAIVFGAGVKHSQILADEFNKAGISARHVDGTTSDKEREEAIKLFEQKEILVLCNYQLYVEGADFPDCNGVILLRPTKSKTVYLQSIGRALRVKADGSRAIILDHANNWKRHGLPCQPQEWTLEGRKKRDDSTDDSSLRIKNCHACFRIISQMLKVCPFCKATQKVAAAKVKKLTIVEGMLEKIDVMRFKDHNYNKAIAQARTLKDFQAIAKKMGYKPGWAWHKYKEHNARRKETTERNIA